MVTEPRRLVTASWPNERRGLTASDSSFCCQMLSGCGVPIVDSIWLSLFQAELIAIGYFSREEHSRFSPWSTINQNQETCAEEKETALVWMATNPVHFTKDVCGTQVFSTQSELATDWVERTCGCGVPFVDRISLSLSQVERGTIPITTNEFVSVTRCNGRIVIKKPRECAYWQLLASIHP